MKWLGAFVVGVTLGVLTGLAALYFNPLSGERATTAAAAEVLSYEFGPNTLALTHGEQLGFDLQPSDVQVLWEATISRSLLGTFVLRDQQGNALGIASRAVKLSADSNLLVAGVMTADHWLVTIPGVGSYFIESNDNIWPLIRDTVIDVNVLHRTWGGMQHYELSAGPLDNGAARVTGTSGRFLGVTGSAIHAIDLENYARTSQLLYPIRGEWRIGLNAPAPQAAARAAGRAATQF